MPTASLPVLVPVPRSAPASHQALPLALTGLLEESQMQVIAVMASRLGTEAIAPITFSLSRSSPV